MEIDPQNEIVLGTRPPGAEKGRFKHRNEAVATEASVDAPGARGWDGLGE